MKVESALVLSKRCEGQANDGEMIERLIDPWTKWLGGNWTIQHGSAVTSEGLG